MITGVFTVLLDRKLLGYTNLEYADNAMGILCGKLFFTEVQSPYHFLKAYALTNAIELYDDDENEKLISLAVLPKIEILVTQTGALIHVGAAIEGMESDDFQITLFECLPEKFQLAFQNANS